MQTEEAQTSASQAKIAELEMALMSLTGETASTGTTPGVTPSKDSFAVISKSNSAQNSQASLNVLSLNVPVDAPPKPYIQETDV